MSPSSLMRSSGTRFSGAAMFSAAIILPGATNTGAVIEIRSSLISPRLTKNFEEIEKLFGGDA